VQTQGGHVHRVGASLDDHLGNKLARYRRMLESVTAETVHQVQPGETCHLADDWVTVGGHLVEAGPGVGERSLGEGRKYPHGRRQELLGDECLIDPGFEGRVLGWVAHAHQDAGALAVEVEARRGIDYQRPSRRGAMKRPADDNRPWDRLDRYIHTGGSRQAPGPWSGCIHYRSGADGSCRGPDPD